MKKILVTGASGMVGSRFVGLFRKKYKLVTPHFPYFDISNKKHVNFLVSDENPDIIINFAAYTNVSEAENQRGDKSGDCWKINVEGTRNIINSIGLKIHFIQISTDMVFPGSLEDKGPYSEDHKPVEESAKVTWYGYTKALAEKNSQTILRLIYPVRAEFDAKLDYIRKPLSLFDQGKLYPLFDNQQISITYIDEACKALDKIIQKKASGIFHASTPDTTTPYELISYVIEKSRGVKNAALTSHLDDNQIRYPKYGGLNVLKTEKALGMRFSPWKKVVDLLSANL